MKTIRDAHRELSDAVIGYENAKMTDDRATRRKAVSDLYMAAKNNLEPLRFAANILEFQTARHVAENAAKSERF